MINLLASDTVLVELVNLRNRTGEERRRKTLRDKRDSSFVGTNFPPNFTFLFSLFTLKNSYVCNKTRKLNVKL